MPGCLRLASVPDLAFLGGFIFRALRLHMPFRGVASTIFVAFVGAVALLLLMRLVRRISGRGR